MSINTYRVNRVIKFRDGVTNGLLSWEFDGRSDGSGNLSHVV